MNIKIMLSDLLNLTVNIFRLLKIYYPNSNVLIEL